MEVTTAVCLYSLISGHKQECMWAHRHTCLFTHVGDRDRSVLYTDTILQLSFFTWQFILENFPCWWVDVISLNCIALLSLVVSRHIILCIYIFSSFEKRKWQPLRDRGNYICSLLSVPFLFTPCASIACFTVCAVADWECLLRLPPEELGSSR